MHSLFVPAVLVVLVANFHHELLGSVGELMGAMGIEHPDNLKPWHLLREPLPATFERALLAASADTFHHTPPGGRPGSDPTRPHAP